VPEPAGNGPAPASHASRPKGQPTLADGPEEAGDDLTNQLLPRAAAIADAERRTSDAAADPGAGKRPTRRTAKGFRARLPAGSSNPALASFFALRLMHSQRQKRTFTPRVVMYKYTERMIIL
jgi:hypothetical protein